MTVRHAPAAARRLALSLGSLAALLLLAADASLAQAGAQAAPLPAHPRKLSTPRLEPYVPPQPVRRTLDSGAELLLIPDHELPLVDGVIAFHAGSIHEAAERAGLTEVLAVALRDGGSTVTSGVQLDEWLDQHAATLDVRAGLERISIEFSCLSEDLAPLLRHVRDLLTQPAYGAEDVEKARSRLLSSIARRDDDISELADATLLRVSYGYKSPWARQPTNATAHAVTAESVAAFHRAHLGPDRMLIGVVGDVEEAALAELLEQEFAEFAPVGDAPIVPGPTFFTPPSTRIYLLDRPGVAQTELRLGALGASRASPEYPGLYLWSNVVGIGGMTNRLMLHVRTQLGLAYSVGAYFRSHWSHPGEFYAWCGTRNDQAGKALEAIMQTLAEARGKKVSTREFDVVRERVLNAEVFRVDSPAKVLDRAVDIAFYGYGEDYWESFDKQLRAATPSEAALSVLRRLTPAKSVAVAVGPADEIRKSLDLVAEVRLLSPEPGVLPSTADGRAAVDRLLAALGGRERWAELRTVEFETHFQVSGLEVPTHQWYSLDEPLLRINHRVQGRKNVVVITPERGFQNDAVSVKRMDLHDHSRMVLAHARWLPRVLHALALPVPELGARLDSTGRLVLGDDLGDLCWLVLGEDGKPTQLGWDGADAGKFEYEEWAESAGYVYAARFLRDGGNGEVEVTSFAPATEWNPDLFDMEAERNGANR